MRTVSTIFGLTMVACLAAAAACSTKSSDSDDSSTKKDAGKKTSGDDDDTTAGGDDSCDKACEASAGAKCKEADSCVADCEADRKKIPTKCKDEGDALYECAAGTEKADWKCDDNDKAVLDGACTKEGTALVKCMQETTTGDDDDADAGDPCETCITSNCATEVSACQKNADCVTLAQCLGKCKDATCEDKCQTDNPDGVDDATAVSSCIGNSCSTECQ